ncbi:transaldolase [Flexivirga alba]|uniref:Transaldolase n=1 Tax=Flexivirga alba TaxID=702742 RepID=A0ABW2AJN7_9MICO
MNVPRTDALQRLSASGVSVWLDDLSRELLAGELDDLVEHYSVVGITSNPTIFASALAQGNRYDEQLKNLAFEGVSVQEAVFRITTDDVRSACDRLRRVYDATNRRNGRVSIEVDPGLAHDTQATVEEARRLWNTVDRENLFVKVPATPEGIPAIEQLIGEGISVNVTLIFSLSRYREVSAAYIAGLWTAAGRKLSLAPIASVASFFVSRVDAAVEKLIGPDDQAAAEALRGQVAIANARLAYQNFKETLRSDDWRDLREQGARPQRPLWASTGVKDPDLRDTLYVEELVAPQTVSTMPLRTLQAVADHGRITSDTITGNYGAAQRTIRTAEDHGVDLAQVTEELEQDGVRKFEASWAELAGTVHQQLAQLEKQEQRE